MDEVRFHQRGARRIPHREQVRAHLYKSRGPSRREVQAAEHFLSRRFHDLREIGISVPAFRLEPLPGRGKRGAIRIDFSLQSRKKLGTFRFVRRLIKPTYISEEYTSELQSLTCCSSAVLCLDYIK